MSFRLLCLQIGLFFSLSAVFLCLAIFTQWTAIFAISSFVVIIFTFLYLYKYILIPLQQITSQSPISCFDDFIRQQIQYQQLQKQHQTLQDLTTQYIEKFPGGLLFIDHSGVILPEYSESLNAITGLTAIANQKIMPLFFTTHTENDAVLHMEEWLSKVVKNIENWETPPYISTHFLSQAQDTKICYLKFTFIPIYTSRSLQKVMVFIEDITQVHNIKNQLQEKDNKRERDFKCTQEIILAKEELLADFVSKLEDWIEFLQEKNSDLGEGTAIRSYFRERILTISQIKNNAHLLNFQTLITTAEKFATLCKIITSKTGEIRVEQLLELENNYEQFVEIVSTYQRITKFWLGELEKQRQNARNKYKTDESKLLVLIAHFQCLYRTAFSNDIYPGEISKYLQETWHAMGKIVPSFPAPNQQTVFEFTDFFYSTLDALKKKIPCPIYLDQSCREKKILLYGNCFTINKVLTLVIYMTAVKGEHKSPVTIYTKILPREEETFDILQIRTYVEACYDSPKTKAMIAKLCREYQKSCLECPTELSSEKQGFALTIPLSVHHQFGSFLNIGILSKDSTILVSKLNECSGAFPFTIKTVISPQDYSGLNILIAESEVLENLSQHIDEKMRNTNPFVPIIALFDRDDSETKEQMFQLGAAVCLSLPVRTTELKWCIFACLDVIIDNLTRAKIVETTVLKKRQRKPKG